MDNIFELMIAEQQKQELEKVIECNEKTARFGLALTKEDAGALMARRSRALRDSRRVEFGESILPELIFAFCDSPYISQENYSDILAELQDIFYHFKNECGEGLADSELLDFMKDQFDGICYGDLEYLREICLERFARAVRGGESFDAWKGERDEYSLGKRGGGYGRLEEEKRWEFELYKKKVRDME